MVKFKKDICSGGKVESDTMLSNKENTDKRKNRIRKLKLFKKCKERTKVATLFLVFALLWGQIPVGATVNDNLSSTIQKLIGAKTDTVGDSYKDSSLHAKLNKLEEEISELQQVNGGTEMQRLTVKKIQAACKAGTVRQILEVGDTFGDEQYTYTVIGIDQDIPCDADGNSLLNSQYGNVLTVMCLGAPVGKGGKLPVVMNASKTPLGTIPQQMDNNGTWYSLKMRTTTLVHYLERLPANTQNAIGYVQKVTGTYNGGASGGENVTTSDRCFLLSEKEVFGGSGADNGPCCTKNEADATFQYQYFQSIATTAESRNINNYCWWLRSQSYRDRNYFCYVRGGNNRADHYYNSYCVFPAFCIY